MNGSLNPTPTVTGIHLGRDSQDTYAMEDTYAEGESVIARVEFSGQVVLTGSGAPSLVLQIGNQARLAVLRFWGRDYLSFRYVVQASDRDDDGISIPANAVSLNGRSIKGAGGKDADLSHDAVPDNPGHKVNGSIGTPTTIERVSFSSRPLSGEHIRSGRRDSCQGDLQQTGDRDWRAEVGAADRGPDPRCRSVWGIWRFHLFPPLRRDVGPRRRRDQRPGQRLTAQPRLDTRFPRQRRRPNARGPPR